MSRKVYEIQGYALVLDKVIFVTRVFEADNGEGFQFNLRMVGDTRVPIKCATRADATLERELFVKALKGQ